MNPSIINVYFSSNNPTDFPSEKGLWTGPLFACYKYHKPKLHGEWWRMAASPQGRQNLARIPFGEYTLNVQITHGVGLAKVELTVGGWGVGGGEEGGRLHGKTGGSCVTVWCTGNWVSLFTSLISSQLLSSSYCYCFQTAIREDINRKGTLGHPPNSDVKKDDLSV